MRYGDDLYMKNVAFNALFSKINTWSTFRQHMLPKYVAENIGVFLEIGKALRFC